MGKGRKAQRPTGQKPRTQQPQAESDAERRRTWIVGVVCLVLGFAMGVVFTVYKTGGPAQPPHPQPSTGAPAQPSPEMLDRIRAMKEETRRHPDNAFAWIALGNGYFDTGQYQKSIEAYETGLQLDPKHADVWTDLGVMYRRIGNPEKAVEAFDKAISIDPSHEIARFNKGVVLLHDRNDPEGAIRAWRGLLEVNPEAMAPNGQPVAELLKQFEERQP
ncbi:MAG: tetratricopeptide repeat protein [Desulfobacteraceae bacterium]|nr:tetratricopeptide repeat protein [Desulfobacteraceae bacterium]